ncbi:Fic family protein [archaeon]|jgi:Fic family protein|nr:Fic family protein [archaeon]MBT4417264.1 Fic family protein [archaeon]
MISEKLYKRILDKRKIIRSLKPFDKLQLKRLKDEFIVEYVYDSTAIEGNTLTLNETKLVLQEGITIGGKSLREHLDVTNQKEAMAWIEKIAKKKIEELDILNLHKITLKGISDYWAGRYKTSQNRIVGSKLKTTPPYKVHSEMKDFVKDLQKNLMKYNPIELAAYAHHEFVRIHPFVDGNGRVARLLCNLVLVSKGYVPIIIRNKDRKKYFDVLEKAHFGNLKEFVNFVGLMEEEALMRYISAFQKTTKKNELLPLSEIAKDSKYSQEYLSLLARRGILPATKINGIWHSSKEEVERYISVSAKK